MSSVSKAKEAGRPVACALACETGEAPRCAPIDARASDAAPPAGTNGATPGTWEARWRAFTGLSSEWYWEQDREQRFTLVTGPVRDRIGIGADDLVGRALWESGLRCDPADRAAVEAAIAARRPFYDLQLERDAVDGAVRRFAVSGEPVHDAAGQWCGYRGIGKDLTERRRAEADAAAARRFACATLDALASHACVLDAAGRILVTNEAWRRFAADNGAGGAGAFKGSSYLAACESARGAARRDGAAVAAAIRAIIAGRGERFVHEYPCDTAAGVRWFVVRLSSFPGEGAERVLVEHEDISARKRAEHILTLEHRVARCLAEQDDENAVMETVIRATCETQGWACGAYLRVDADADALRTQACWAVPGGERGAFLERIRDLVVPADECIAGRVRRHGEPLWVEDVARDARTCRCGSIASAGARGAFAFPVTVSGEVAGVFAFFSAEVREPDERLLAAVGVIGVQVGQYLQRRRAERALRDTARQQSVIAAFGQQALASAGTAELFDLAAAALAQGLACDRAAIEACGGTGPSLLAPAGAGRDAFPGEDVGGAAAFVQSIANILATALERRSAEERIARLAQYDALTGLPNRTLLRERLAQATGDARRHQRYVAVMFLDLDDFKLVNDSFGHGVGDEVLVRVAQRLRESVRDGDTVGRLGGDEFAIVLSDMASPGDAHVVAQRIADSLAKPVVLDGREIGVSASIGIAVHPGAGDDPAMLLKNADAAMYRAKQRGRDGCEVYTGA